MPLRLSPGVRATLRRGDAEVELSYDDLCGLRAALPPGHALSRDALGALFVAGLAAPGALIASGAEAWASRLGALRLSPRVQIAPVFCAGDVEVVHLEPPVAAFLAPAFVDVAQALWRELDLALLRMARSAAVRGLALPKKRALARLHEIAGATLEARPEVAAFAKVRRSPRLEIALDETAASSGACSLTHVGLDLRADGGRARAIVPLADLAPLAAVIESLRTGGSVAAEALAPVAVRRVLDALDAVSGLTDASRPAPRHDADADLVVTHMGHAFLVVDGGGARLLVDPVLHAWSDDLGVQPLAPTELGAIDAIAFTHHHVDHLDPSSLLLLPHDVPVIVPADMPATLAPKMAAFLRAIGFRDVREVRDGDVVDVGGGLRIEAAPFHGEGRARVGFGASAYVVSRGDEAVLVYADSSPDDDGRSAVSSGAVRALAKKHGRLSAVFGTWWQERELVGLLSPLAPFLFSPARWLDETELCDCSPEHVEALVRAARARLFVRYAESGRRGFLPRGRTGGYVPSVSLFWRGVDAYESAVRRARARFVTAEPFRRFVFASGRAPRVVDDEDAARRT